jgi:hypothetical protein
MTYWAAEFTAEEVRAISGAATTIVPLTRTDRSSHHRRSRPGRAAAGRDERISRILTVPPQDSDHQKYLK